jgi:hypothetical protein
MLSMTATSRKWRAVHALSKVGDVRIPRRLPGSI